MGIVARSTIEKIFAKLLGEQWMYAASYHRGIVATVEEAATVFEPSVIARLKEEIKAAWTHQCDEEYETARSFAGCSSRLFGMDGLDHEAIDARNLRRFDEYPRVDAACPY